MVVEEAIGDATLHNETLAELGLNDQPFIDNKKLNRFSDSTTQKVRAAMEQHLRFGESIHLFVGEKGVGKTVFLSQLIKHCKSSIQPFVAKGTDNFETVAFLAAVLNQLGGEEAESIEDHVDALIPLFEELADDQKSVVLAIDDAHLAPLEEIAELIDIMPAFIKDNDDKTARLLLTGEPRLKDELTAIADELEDNGFSFEHATTTLYPLDESRVGDYLTSQLNQAGFTDAFPFTEKAVGKIHRESGGLPANINSQAGKYLNTVYSGKAAGAGGKGFVAALGWPLLALGAAAMGLIAWGLSMFFGNSVPDTVVTIDSPTVVESVVTVDETEQPDVTEPVVVVSSEPLMKEPETPEVLVATDNFTNQPEVNAGVASPTVADTQADALLKPEDRLAATVSTEKDELPMATTLPMPENTVENAAPEPVIETVTETVIEVAAPVTETVVQATEDLVTPVPSTSAVDNVENTVAQVTPAEVPNSVEVAVPNTSIEVAQNSAAVADEPDTDASLINDLNETSGIAVAIDPLNPAGINNTVQTTNQSNNSPVTSSDNGLAIPVEAPIANRAIENERWVLFQTPTKFTVQLATSKERTYIIDLAQTLEAEDPVAIYPFLTSNSNNPVFGLLSGLYDTRSEAIAAVDRMAAETKKFGVWIRPIADLQADIKKRR